MEKSFHLVLAHGITTTQLPQKTPSDVHDFFHERFPRAQIWEFQFPGVPLAEATDSTDIKQQGRIILDTLLKENRDDSSSRNIPLVFLGHELGGSLIKQILLIAVDESKYRQIAERVKGMIFIGTPHRGTDATAWEQHIIRLLAASEIQSDSPSQMLHNLPLELKECGERFQAAPWGFNIVNIFSQEEEGNLCPAVIHEAFTSLEIQCDTNIGVRGTHSQLWKFEPGALDTEMLCNSLENLTKAEHQNLEVQVQLQRFLSTLSQLDPGIHHSRTESGPRKSVDWITSNKSYQEWATQPETGILHVWGSPDAGTAALASQILELMLAGRSYPEAVVLRFYFNQQDIRARSRMSLFTSLCRQLVLARPSLFLHVLPLCEYLLGKRLFSAESLQSLFSSLVLHSTGDTIYCVIHAVHECEAPFDDVVQSLSWFTRSASVSFKVILTSDNRCSTGSNPYTGVCREIEVGNGSRALGSMETLVQDNIAQAVKKNPLWADFETDIIAMLCSTQTTYSQAMHTVASLESTTIRSTRSAFSQQLSQLRSALLQSHRQSSRNGQKDWVHFTFRWIGNAVRPLQETELAVAVALEECGGNYSDISELIPRDIVGDLVRTAGPCVKVADNCVVPVHRHLRELLYSDDEESSDPHFQILSICLNYLQFLKSTSYDPLENKIPSKLEHGLLDYASVYWSEHYKRTSQALRLHATARVSNFLKDKESLNAWARIYEQRQGAFLHASHFLLNSPLQVICLFGFVELAEESIIRVKSDFEGEDQLKLALDQAARHGHRRIVEMLLHHGARSPDASILAAAGGHDGVLEELLLVDPTVNYEDANKYTPLHHAACCGHKEVVIALTRQKAPLNALTEDGCSPLCLAARTGHAVIAKELIDRGADIRIEDERGFDALKFAAQGGFSQIVIHILNLKKCADAAKPAKDGNTALHLAAQFGHSDIVEVLLQHCNNVNCMNNANLTPLHMAAKKGFLRIVEQLLDAQSESGSESCHFQVHHENRLSTHLILSEDRPQTPMQLAAHKGHFKVVQALLNHKTGHAAEDCCGSLYFAAASGSTTIVRELLDHNTQSAGTDSLKNTLLHQAIKGGSASVLSMLLDSALDINSPNNSHFTPLHMAAEIGNLAMVRMLLEHGADVEARTANKETPLHFAARGGRRLVVQELMRRMDDVRQLDSNDETAFDLALKWGHVEIVADLLQAREELDWTLHIRSIIKHEGILKTLLNSGLWDRAITGKKLGQSPLHIAVEMELRPSVEVLLDAKADRNAKDSEGRTPLFRAAENNSLEIVRTLVEAKSDVNIADGRDRTPLFIASWGGHVQIVKELLKEGSNVDVNRANDRGWTPLHAAYDQPEVTELLLKAKADHKKVTKHTRSTALLMASFYDHHIEVVQHHLDAKASPDRKDNDGETAVHRAVIGGSFSILEVLVQHGANLNSTRNDGCTPLHLAAGGGEKKIALFLLDQNVDTLLESDLYGTTLMAVACGGLVDVADRLPPESADVNAVRTQHHTALHAAALNGKLAMVEWLIGHAADVNASGGEYGSPLCAAIMGTEGDTHDIVRTLLDNGADVNYTLTGDSVLRIAVNRGLDAVVKLLLEYRAKTRESPDKEPLVFTAVLKGQMGIFDALIAIPDTIAATDKFGRSLLSNAIVSKRETVVSTLLGRQNIEVNEKDHEGRTPLILAIIHRSGCLQKLLQKSPNMDDQDTEGKTALIHACILDLKESVTILLAAGANPTVVDFRGRGPLYWACRRSSMAVFEQILQNSRFYRDSKIEEHCRNAMLAAIASNRSSFLLKLFQITKGSSGEYGEDGWTPLYTADRYELDSVQQRLLRLGHVRESHAKFPRKLPSTWSSSDKTNGLLVDSTKQLVTVGDGPYTSAPWEPAYGTIRADYAMDPIPELENVYYYEVKIEENRGEGSWAVGFCEEHTPLNLVVGWGERSWGYHGDDGLAFSEGVHHAFGDTYSTGDVIGCGVNFTEKAAFYTKNGKIIGQAFSDVKGKVYPAISVDLSMVEAQMSVKFWKGDVKDFYFQGSFTDPETLQPPNEGTSEADCSEDSDDIYLHEVFDEDT